jgi:small GTP-binding protein
VKVQVNTQDVNLQLWDTAGQEDLENIRVLSYTNTDIFLLCFAISEPTSFDNVQAKWLPELKQHVKSPVVVLVGTKIDLREDDSTIQRLSSEGKCPITKEQGEEKAKNIGAQRYVECSSIN